jgi:selenocysteine lyase/cysteine desulfurase
MPPERDSPPEPEGADVDVVPGDRLPDGRIAGERPRLIDRRSLLLGSGAALAGGGFAVGRLTAPERRASGIRATARREENLGSRAQANLPTPGDWEGVRAQFAAPTEDVHLDGFVLAVPPLTVRNAVGEYRRRLDVDGIDYVHREQAALEAGVRQAAARYMRTDPALIALTDSTTMGLGVVYGAARLEAGDELVTSVHDFYATQEAMRFAAARTGAAVRIVRLYDKPGAARRDELVERVIAAVGPRTRMVAVTWVHSSSGVRYPVRALAARLASINEERPPGERALLVVDGVHGFGVEETAVPQLGCDVFVSGCHKWLYGPRGTGIIWARRRAWSRFAPVIPTFDLSSYEAWRTGHPVPLGLQQWSAAMTPGGFHSFENRWALAEAFDFHEQLGRRAVANRIATLTDRLRHGLSKLRNVRMVSPDDPQLQSAIVCFMVRNIDPERAVEQLRLRGVHISITPYREVFLRAGCPLWVNEYGVDRAVAAIGAL